MRFDSKRLLFSKKQSETILEVMVRDVCEAVDSPRALAVWLLFSSGEHDQLLELKVNPSYYQESHRFADDYLVTSFLSKYPNLRTTFDRKEVAMKSFFAAEQKCLVTNNQLYNRLQANARAAHILWSAREKCKWWLPELSVRDPFGRSTYDRIFDAVRWGPGVTSAAKGVNTAAYNKFQAKLEATPELIAVGAHHVVNSIPMWSTFHSTGNPENPSSVTPDAFISIPGNTVTTVPKSAKTDRTIAVEPHVNAFLQRGIGIVLRDELKRRGFDLRSQERNQILARKGSLDGSLATVDLKGASDTISKEIVAFLLPDDWVRLLNSARSASYKVDGKWCRYHKHSSMGNGYTFELETLIFATVSLAVCEYLGLPTHEVSVYGDDIIVPGGAYDLLEEVLQVCGFEINRDKSFHDGPFRESCGQDYFAGTNVRPFFVREAVDSIPALYRLANNLRRYGALRLSSLGYDRRFLRAWKGLYLSCPTEFRYRCPEGVGDVGFVSELDESLGRISRHAKRGCEAVWRFSGLRFDSESRPKVDSCISVASALYHKSPSPVGSENETWDEIQVRGMWSISESDHTMYDLRQKGRWRVAAFEVTRWPFRGEWY